MRYIKRYRTYEAFVQGEGSTDFVESVPAGHGVAGIMTNENIAFFSDPDKPVEPIDPYPQEEEEVNP